MNTRLVWGLWIVFAAALFAFWPLHNAGFVYDDHGYVEKNPGIRQISLSTLFVRPERAAAPESGLASDAYRPIVTLSFALDYHYWKLNAAGYHIENLLLHFFNALIVGLFLRRYLRADGAWLLATTLFLWHPVQVQSVAWISQRSTVLGSAGMLLALIALRPPGPWSWGRLMAGWLAYTAALLSRETAAGVLPALAALDIWQKHIARERSPPQQDRPDDARRFWLRYIGLFMSTLGYAAARTHLLPSWSEFPGQARQLVVDASLGVMAVALYCGKLLLPVALRLHYAYPPPGLWGPFSSVCVVMAYVACIAGCVRRSPATALALGWIGVFLMPVLQIIPIRAFAADRYLYFPMIGFGWLCGILYQRFPKGRLLFWMWAVGLWFVSVRTVPIWHSEEMLWAESVRQDPTDAFARVALASLLQDPRKAELHLKAALMQNNSSASIHETALINLSWRLLEQGRYKQASLWANRALEADPSNPHALINLARACEGLGEHAKARRFRERFNQSLAVRRSANTEH